MPHVSWDPILIGISFLVAFIASFVSLDCAGKVVLSSHRGSVLWRLAAGFTLGMGIWPMHFIGMLAMKMDMPVNYDLILTALSLLIALLTATAAIGIAISGTALTRARLFSATALLGMGVVSMHYVGMAAMMDHASIRWNTVIIALSVVIAIVASGIGLWLAFNLKLNAGCVFINRLMAALVMALAIASMHYTGMRAATFTSHVHAIRTGLDTLALSICVAAMTLLILGTVLVTSMIDSQIRMSQLTDNLHSLNHQLEHQMQYDALTGLANRNQIDACLQGCLRESALHQHHFALAFIDLDHFKEVNDTWGHHIGDRLLIASTQRICACLDETMTLARLGGDEFILLIPNKDTEAIALLMDRIASAIRTPFPLSGYTILVSLSAGLSLYPEHGSTLHGLKVKADMAMYHVKREGRNGWAFWRPEMESASSLAQGKIAERAPVTDA